MRLMTVMIDGKPVQREIDYVDICAEPFPRPVPVLYGGESIVWFIASAAPTIIKVQKR